MPTVTNPSVDADEAHEALGGLAHATRSIHDPSEIYAVLGSLTSGLASLERVLRQLGEFHDGPASKRTWMTGDPRTGRAASYQVAWELHRAAEIVHQVAGALWIAPMRSRRHHLRLARLSGTPGDLGHGR